MSMEEQSSPDVENPPPNKETKDSTRKILRVLTVVAYLSSVSMAAIMLSLYYIFLWNPMPPDASRMIQTREEAFGLIQEKETNRTSFMPEEPLALPVQIAESRQGMSDMSQINSDVSDNSWDNQDGILKSFRKKRSIFKKVLKSLKLA